MANDDGNLIFFSKYELRDFLIKEPDAEKYIRKYLGSEDFINNKSRFCLWLLNVDPSDVKKLPETLIRIEKVKQYRLNSKRDATRKLASFPTLFAEIRQPESDFLVIPSVSSERRVYIPIGYEVKNTIPNTDVLIIPNAPLFSFGILTSIMHMVWVRQTCGRLKSDYRYSASLVYNNFPWPENPSEKQIKAVEEAAQKVLDVRAKFPESSLADLYDPNTMPPELVKAHQALDKAVDLCYRSQPFINETKRIEFFFEFIDE